MENYNPAALAYLGDAVFELLVRNKYFSEVNTKAGSLHKKTVNIVNASSQAKMTEKLIEIMNEDETAVYKRGRNAAVHSMPKNARINEYCKATGLEAVFGQLYIDGKTERLSELFNSLMESAEIDG